MNENNCFEILKVKLFCSFPAILYTFLEQLALNKDFSTKPRYDLTSCPSPGFLLKVEMLARKHKERDTILGDWPDTSLNS